MLFEKPCDTIAFKYSVGDEDRLVVGQGGHGSLELRHRRNVDFSRLEWRGKKGRASGLGYG